MPSACSFEALAISVSSVFTFRDESTICVSVSPTRARDRDAVVRTADRLLDHMRGLLRRLGRALREVAHLFSHDREALAVLAGAGRLDGRVEREQVRLERDVVDDLDDLGDLFRGFLDPVHRLVHRAHLFVAAIGVVLRVF